MNPRVAVFLLLGVISIVGAVLLPPIPQDLCYHDFADQRPWMGIPNAADVLSNLPFVVVGALGLFGLRVGGRLRAGCADSRAVLPWQVFFAGVLLTGPGSGWYHLDPDNASLVWDRLPMTLCFMGFLSAVVGERLGTRIGRRLLVPLLVIGMGSVLHWYYGELKGEGDLRLYGLVQLFPVVALPLLLLLYPSRSGGDRWLWGVLAAYLVAKGLEAWDRPVYHLGGVVSGHTLKHLAAAVAPAFVIRLLAEPRPVDNAIGG